MSWNMDMDIGQDDEMKTWTRQSDSEWADRAFGSAYEMLAILRFV